MPPIQAAADFQSICVLTRIPNPTPEKNVCKTLLRRLINQLTVTICTLDPSVFVTSIEKMPQFQIAADFQPIRILTRFLH
jgi:hypothetical protein